MQANRRRIRRQQGGFTLAEIIVTTVLAGIFFVAAIAALQAGTESNIVAADIATANTLINEIKEWTVDLPFTDPDEHDFGKPPGADSYSQGLPYVDDLDDLMNTTYTPPRDSQGDPIADLPGWSQHIDITWRDPADINTVVWNGFSTVVYVEVTARKNGVDVLSRGWIVTRKSTDPEFVAPMTY